MHTLKSIWQICKFNSKYWWNNFKVTNNPLVINKWEKTWINFEDNMIKTIEICENWTKDDVMMIKFDVLVMIRYLR